MSEQRLEKTLELDASPEQVWAAIATGPGISAWFVPTEVVARGEIRQDFGSGNVATGQVSAYEPGGRFRYGARPEAAERARGTLSSSWSRPATAAAPCCASCRAGSTTTPRGGRPSTTSLDTGWDLFFANLASLPRALRRASRSVGVTVMGWAEALTPAEAWPVLYRALGLTDRPARRRRGALTPDGPAPIEGVVDVSSDEFLGVRSEHGAAPDRGRGQRRAAGSAPTTTSTASSCDGAAATSAWQTWLTRLFPSAQPMG